MRFLLIFFIFGWRSWWGRTYRRWRFGSYRIFLTSICRKLFFCPKFYAAVFNPNFIRVVPWAWFVLVRGEASYHWAGAWCFRVWRCWWEGAGLGRGYFEIVETHFDYLLKLYYYLIVAWSSPVLVSLSAVFGKKLRGFIISYLGRRNDIKIKVIKMIFLQNWTYLALCMNSTWPDPNPKLLDCCSISSSSRSGRWLWYFWGFWRNWPGSRGCRNCRQAIWSSFCSCQFKGCLNFHFLEWVFQLVLSWFQCWSQDRCILFLRRIQRCWQDRRSPFCCFGWELRNLGWFMVVFRLRWVLELWFIPCEVCWWVIYCLFSCI